MRDKGVSSFTIFKWNLFVKSVTSSCSDDTCCDACYAPTAALTGPPSAPAVAPVTVSETTAPTMIPAAKLAEPVMAF